jgi:hypothetical protein
MYLVGVYAVRTAVANAIAANRLRKDKVGHDSEA